MLPSSSNGFSLKIGVPNWFRKKLDPFLRILRRGAEPKQLAFSAALGITLGVFPICGLCYCFSVCHGHRSTKILMPCPYCDVSQFVATPVELSLIIVFLRFGELITGGPHFPLTADALKKVLTGRASVEILQSILHALLGWLVAAPFILAVLHVLFLPFFTYLVRKFSTGHKPLSPRSPPRSLPEVKLKMRDV